MGFYTREDLLRIYPKSTWFKKINDLYIYISWIVPLDVYARTPTATTEECLKYFTTPSEAKRKATYVYNLYTSSTPLLKKAKKYLNINV